MDKVRSRDGTRIAFERAGSGEPLILVGGALSDRHAAASLASRLAERYSVVSFDRRGRGDSDDTPPYAVEREVEDIEALIDEVGGSTGVYGHSSGGALALEAARSGAAIARLAVYEPPFIVDDSRPPLPDDYAERLRELVAAGRRSDAVAYFLSTGVGLPAEMVDGMRQAPEWPGREALAHTLEYDALVLGDAMAGRPLDAGRWTSVTIPALVMDGGASPKWQRESVRAVAGALPNASTLTLEAQDHRPAEEVLAQALIGFFG